MEDRREVADEELVGGEEEEEVVEVERDEVEVERDDDVDMAWLSLLSSSRMFLNEEKISN